MSALLAIVCIAYVGEIALDLWLTRKWKQIRDDALAALAANNASVERYEALADKQRNMLALQLGWNELAGDRDRWPLMSTAEKEHHLARERALWAATFALTTEGPS
jgi:hypothetical protein